MSYGMLVEFCLQQTLVYAIHFFQRIKVDFDFPLPSVFLDGHFSPERLFQGMDRSFDVRIERRRWFGALYPFGHALRMARYEDFGLSDGIVSLNDFSSGVDDRT